MNNKSISDIFPFKMYGNLYFIGSTRVSVHLIETESGLVLIDTGWPDMGEQIIDSMKILGFRPEDICAIIHSHGHIDHYGCTNMLKNLSGAKTYISRIDSNTVNKYDLRRAESKYGYKTAEKMEFDVLLEDGDVINFGKTMVRCVLTPGHSPGVMSFFVNIEEDGKTIIAGMHGGVGMNGLQLEALKMFDSPVEIREVFRDGLHRLKREKVDLVMGNHPGQTGTAEKLQKVMNGESVVDPNEWERFLCGIEKKLDDLIASGR